MRVAAKLAVVLTGLLALTLAALDASETPGTAAGQARAVFIPLVRFDRAEATEGWRFNPWGKGRATSTFTNNDTFGKTLKLEWEKGSTLSNPDLFRKLSDSWKNKYPASGFYFRLRGDLVPGSGLQVHYMMKQNTRDFAFCNDILWMKMRAENGWLLECVPLGGKAIQHDFQFNIAELEGLMLTCYGRGCLEIAEIGLIVRYAELETQSAVPGTNLATVPEKTGAVVIDGKMDEAAWAAARKIELRPGNEKDARKLCVPGPVPGEKTEAFLLWDKAGLYIGANCFKTDMRNLKCDYTENHNELYTDECVEIYLDPDKTENLHPGMRKFDVNANGKYGILFLNKKRDERCGFTTAARKFQDRWEMEFFIPWQALGMTPGYAAFLGFNMTRQTYGAPQERSGWTTTKWNGIADFGTLVCAPAGAGEKPFPVKIDLGFVSPGNYLLYAALTGKANLYYRMKLFKADGAMAAKSGVTAGSTLCESFGNKLTSNQNYTLKTAAYDADNGAVSFLQTTFTDGPAEAGPALSGSSIALFPVPKEFSLGTGVLKIDGQSSVCSASPGLDYCVEKVSGELEKFYGIKLANTKNINDATIVLGLADDLKDVLQKYALEKDAARIKYDGFILYVTDNKIIAAALEKRGVLYAADALTALVKMSSPETGPARIRHLKVVDWPYFKTRPLMLAMNAFFFRTKHDVAFVERMLEKFPMAFRYNLYSFDLLNAFLWPSVPSHKNPISPYARNCAWTKDEFGNVVDFINTNMCPVFPDLNSLGHMGSFFDQMEALRPLVDMGDNLFQHRLCTRHPDTYKVLFGMYDDLLAICGKNKEYDTAYFHVGFDEFWPDAGPECPRCKGIPRNKLYLDHLKKITDYLKARGKRPIIWSDMLVEEHNGLASSRIAEIRDQLPKEVIIANWSGALQDAAIPRFTKNGHEVWKIRTGYHISRLNDEQVRSAGLLVCTYHWWLSFSRHLYSGSSYGLAAQALMANAAWNSFPDNDDSSWSEYCRVYGKFLMHNWSRKPLPGAGGGFVPVDISAIADQPVSDNAAGDGQGWFDGGPEHDLANMDFSTKEIEGVPVAFARKNGEPHCALFKAGATNSSAIKINARLGSLILLHAADLPPEKCSAFQVSEMYPDPAGGLELASYRVNYADGTSSEFTVNYGWNILHWQNSPEKLGAGGERNSDGSSTVPGVFAKYLPDARSFWEGHTREALKRRRSADIAIYQFEWPNPSPEKSIASVEIKNKGVPHISYALLAITGRTVK